MPSRGQRTDRSCHDDGRDTGTTLAGRVLGDLNDTCDARSRAVSAMNFEGYTHAEIQRILELPSVRAGSALPVENESEAGGR